MINVGWEHLLSHVRILPRQLVLVCHICVFFNYRTKKGDARIPKTIKEVIVFKEDTFNQGDFAIITEDGTYLFECEIEIDFDFI